MRLCIDIDNVLSCTDVVMRELIGRHAGGVDLAYEDIKDFDYWRCRNASGQQITRQQWDLVHEAFSTPEVLHELKVVEGAKAALQTLSTAHEIHVVTSRLSTARIPTETWLSSLGLCYHGLHFAAHRQKHLLRIDFALAVEDDYEQAVLFSESGVNTILLRHPWNDGRPANARIVWAADWREVERIVADAPMRPHPT